jgi:excisionase family DNA binding protein
MSEVQSVESAMLTVSETAERLNCSPQQVRKLINNSALPAIRIGWDFRISPETLDGWIKNGGAVLRGTAEAAK